MKVYLMLLHFASMGLGLMLILPPYYTGAVAAEALGAQMFLISVICLAALAIIAAIEGRGADEIKAD